MGKGVNYLITFFVFGFFVTALAGLIASWIDRKVTARVQYRVGPPLLQPLIDLVKLSGKELLIPQTAARTTFLIAPVMGLSSVILVSTLLWMNDLHFGQSFLGDLIAASSILLLVTAKDDSTVILVISLIVLYRYKFL